MTTRSMHQALQAHMSALANEPSIQAALFCFGPHPQAEELRYLASHASPELFELLTPISARFKNAGASESIREPVNIGSKLLHIVSVANGSPEHSSYILAVVSSHPSNPATVSSLSKVAYACTGESYSPRWK